MQRLKRIGKKNICKGRGHASLSADLQARQRREQDKVGVQKNPWTRKHEDLVDGNAINPKFNKYINPSLEEEWKEIMESTESTAAERYLPQNKDGYIGASA